MHAASWFSEFDEGHDEPLQRKKDVFSNFCGMFHAWVYKHKCHSMFNGAKYNVDAHVDL